MFLVEGARVGAGSMEPSSPHRVPHMRVCYPPLPAAAVGRTLATWEVQEVDNEQKLH